MKNLFTKTLLSVAAIAALTSTLLASPLMEIGDGSVSDEMTTVTLFDGTKYILTGFNVALTAGWEYKEAVLNLDYEEKLSYFYANENVFIDTAIDFGINTEVNTHLGITSNFFLNNMAVIPFATVGMERYSLTSKAEGSQTTLTSFNDMPITITETETTHSVSPYLKTGLSIFNYSDLSFKVFGSINKDYLGIGASFQTDLEELTKVKDLNLIVNFEKKVARDSFYETHSNATFGVIKKF